ncbi:conserved hypothetical protein [Paecilomyces variotii No. 5]|uniref:Uncharacterized protein n=1 Tax=Byssochlamys spectabilis (strain No. 5 / NBRC 109023) TaxID=1356009 RepID=V5FT61_BYSSN|nr:conserved hypothetical protein [Paecilomyces variotii No. 5]
MNGEEGGETATMSATNGELHPPAAEVSAPATPGKRKRISSPDESVQDDARPSAPQKDSEPIEDTLRYLVTILAKDDIDLGLLKCSLTSASPTKPRSKRAKISGDRDETNSIDSKATAGLYKGIQDFLDDVEKASSSLIDRLPSGESNTALVARIAAFKRRMNTLLLQTSLLKKSVIKAEPSDDSATPADGPALIKGEREDKAVLTLFGNPSNPKHLFSSLQKPLKVSLFSASGNERSVDLNAHIRESALPNGITTTKVAPFNVEAQPESNRTLGDVFAPPPTLPQLEAPRKTKSWPRQSSSVWIDPFEAITDMKTIPGGHNNYGFASLPSGHWLQYGGATSSPSYWSRKQKQHSQNGVDKDSTEKQGETPIPPEDVSDLVQGAYSSFAPSFDSSGAIVQSHSKNLVWYAKRGQRRFRTLVALYNAAAEQSEYPALEDDLDESSLEDAVKAFEPDSLPEEKPKVEEETDSKELDDVLREVSELLETLNSYNQIRSLDPSNATLPNPESKEAAKDNASADVPSSAEKEIYETLKASLAAIVANLPPYAVAKLNGEQLADLNISQKVIIKNPDYHGTMEQDDYTTQQMRLAAAAAPAAAGVNRTSTPHIAPSSRSGSFQGTPGAVGAYNQRVYPPNARVPPPTAGYQPGQQYYAGRQASTSTPYTPGTPQAYAGARPPVPATGRPGYVAPYSQPAATLQQFQRAGPNGYGPYSTPQGVSAAQGSPQAYAARPGQPGAYNASFGAARSASPQKPPGYVTPQSRTPYVNAASSNPQQRYHAQQQPPHYGAYAPNQASPPPAAAYSNSATPANYSRSAAEQAALMDRNKAQIAANQQRQTSGTPQPPVPQPRPHSSQSNSQERSVTPGSRPNGTPTPAGTAH